MPATGRPYPKAERYAAWSPRAGSPAEMPHVAALRYRAAGERATHMTDLPGRPSAESQEFYRLRWEPVLDLGWIVTLADPAWPGSSSA
jgi:hypothetical protein